MKKKTKENLSAAYLCISLIGLCIEPTGSSLITLLMYLAFVFGNLAIAASLYIRYSTPINDTDITANRDRISERADRCSEYRSDESTTGNRITKALPKA